MSHIQRDTTIRFTIAYGNIFRQGNRGEARAAMSAVVAVADEGRGAQGRGVA